MGVDSSPGRRRRIVFTFEPALFVAPDADADAMETARVTLTRRLAEARAACT